MGYFVILVSYDQVKQYHTVLFPSNISKLILSNFLGTVSSILYIFSILALKHKATATYSGVSIPSE